ncbi:MAG: helix-turn-helix transcriptional regulator [Butyrivibrio sp.]|nr:helix-turn-helix transcriptional regulator [Butyrivibrio sp.]
MSRQVRYYYIDMVFCALGFVVFAASRWITRNPKAYKAMMVAAALLYITGTILLVFLRTAKVYRFIAPLTMLCLGIIGGMTYYCMSRYLADSGCLGRVMGAGGAAAIMLQFALQMMTDFPVVLLTILVAGLLVLVWLINRLPWDWQLPGGPGIHKQEEGDNISGRPLHISLVCAVVITVSMLMLCQYYDSKLEIMAVQSDFEALNPYEWPRLYMIITYLIMGFLGDLKNGKYLPLFSLCAMLVSVLTPILLADSGKYLLCMCLFYINVGVTISYYNMVFCRLAPSTGWPQLWAGMGRVLDGLTGIMVYVLHIAALSVPTIIVIDIILLIGMIVAMVVSGEFTLTSSAQDDAQKIKELNEIKEIKEIKISFTDLFNELCRQYSLTSREAEVLQKLLFTEDDLQTIADSMYISRRVLSRHISSIYQKTGAKSRIGLYQIYHAACQEI